MSQGRLSIRLIVSPPRTSSTLIETSLASSRNVKFSSHEPFIQAGYGNDNTDLGYKNIYDDIGGEKFENSGQPTTVVIKELSHRLNINDEYRKLFNLARDPVLFLIRNPLLTVESRIKKIVQTLPMKARVSTQQWLLNHFASDLRDREPDLETQIRLLDHYGQSLGFLNWDDFIKFSVNEQDYRQLGDVLKIDEDRFILDASGNESMEEQIRYLEREGKGVMVLDSTDFRLSPEHVMRQLCEVWAIIYRNEMILWGNRDLNLQRGGKKFQDLAWYDSLSDSKGVKPPLEIPTTLNRFPKFVQEHLLQIDLPQYIRLSKHPRRICGEDGAAEREFEITVKLEDKARLTELGVITLDVGNSAVVRIHDIDPIYTLLRHPKRPISLAYLNRKKAYTDVFKVLQKEGGIQLDEGDFPGRRK